MSTIREILESMNQPPAGSRPADQNVGDPQVVGANPEVDSPIGDVDTSGEDEAAEQQGGVEATQSPDAAPSEDPVSSDVASPDVAPEEKVEEACDKECSEEDKVEEACSKTEEDKESATIEEEMAMDVVTHPKHGKVGWINKGNNIHAITKNGKEVFQGTQKEVAERFSAIRKEASTMNEEQTPTQSFAQEFSKSMNEGIEFKINLAESDMSSLFESQGLTEEFSKQATEIFEAAVNDVAKTHIEKINNYAGYVFESMMEQKMEEHETSVQEFISTVVAEWVEENQLAIEQGSRNHIAESFMDSLQGLLKEHFVEVPEQKADLYESTLENTSIVATQLKESEEQNAALLEELKTVKKQLVVESVTKGMTELGAEKLRTMSNDLVFENEESFITKLNVLKESYIAPKKTEEVSLKATDAILEDIGEPIVEQIKEEVKPQVDPMVARLAASMKKFL